jgi:hypothetical protein
VDRVEARRGRQRPSPCGVPAGETRAFRALAFGRLLAVVIYMSVDSGQGMSEVVCN